MTTEDGMLVHNLPIAAPPIQSRAGGEPTYKADELPLVPVRKVQAVLQGLDLLALTAAAWPILVQGYPSNVPTGLLVVLAIVVGWWAASDSMAVYNCARLGNVDGIARSAILCVAVGCSVLLCAALFATGTGNHPLTAAFRYATPFALYVITARIAWWTILRSLLADGYCIDRVIVLAESISAARILAGKIERITAGRARVITSPEIPLTNAVPDIARIAELLQSRHVTRLVVAAGGFVNVEQDRLISAFSTLPVGITFLLRGGTLRHIGCSGRAVLDITASELPLTPAEQSAKRAVDIIIAGIVLTLLSPILVGIAVAIRFDSPGPAIFKQKRVGQNGATFDIWKFRTMYNHMRDELGTRQTSRTDPRVTRIGTLLRRSSLDELPQVINVLRGDMSIVGPRPHTLGMTVDGQTLDTLSPSYQSRHRVKPGITGWAQVNGCRGELTTSRAVKRRVALDCHYIDNWSIGFDARIILRTALLMISDRHAF